MHTGWHVAKIGNFAVERPRAAAIGFGRVALVAEELGVDARAALNGFRARGLFRRLWDIRNVRGNGWQRRFAANRFGSFRRDDERMDAADASAAMVSA